MAMDYSQQWLNIRPKKKGVDLTIYDRPDSGWNTKKYRLLQKHDCKCYYCGCDLKVSTCQFEHVIPRSSGGQGGVRSGNIVPACYRCNMKKGTKNLEQFRIKLFGKKVKGTFHFEKLESNGEKIHRLVKI